MNDHATKPDYEPYPRVCECCTASDPGSYELAIAAGWKLGWDGWVCVDCLRESTVH